jgi:hypothetical protein
VLIHECVALDLERAIEALGRLDPIVAIEAGAAA